MSSGFHCSRPPDVVVLVSTASCRDQWILYAPIAPRAAQSHPLARQSRHIPAKQVNQCLRCLGAQPVTRITQPFRPCGGIDAQSALRILYVIPWLAERYGGPAILVP